MDNIGYYVILYVELMATYNGLRMIWELDIKDLLCYYESKFAIKLIYVNVWLHYVAILRNVKEFLSREWGVQIFHTFREGNDWVDYLAKHGSHNNEAHRSFAEPLVGIITLLLVDTSETLYSR